MPEISSQPPAGPGDGFGRAGRALLAVTPAFALASGSVAAVAMSVVSVAPWAPLNPYDR